MKASRLGGLFALAVLAHIESLSYWFVSTDTFALIRSSRVESTRDLVTVFTDPMMHGTGFTNVALFYRPLSSLSFALDYWLWGLDPAGYHATNLVLHGLAVVLAAVVVAEVTRDGTAGLVAGGLFSLHPLTAEVVPVVARRMDVVMLVFVLASIALFVRGRREGSASLYAASVGAYALALAAKEPALLLPPLVAVWVVSDRGESRPLSALRDAVRSVLPFAAVTAGYLVVRLAVLGGLGGYLERPSLAVGDLPALGSKYALSLWYPANVVGIGATDDGAWLVVLIGLAILAGAMLGWAVPATARHGAPPQAGALLGLGVGLAAIPGLFALDRTALRPALVTLGYVGSPGELPFPYPYHGPVGPLVGLALIGVALAGVIWSAVGPGRSVLDGRAIAFFSVWLILPAGLFYRSGDYAIRSGYPSLVPAMALLAVLLVAGFRQLEAGVPAAPVLSAAILLLVVPMIAVSPLVHPYDGWSASGEVNRLTLTGLEGELADAPAGVPVEIVGIPTGIREQRQGFPRVASIGYLGPGSIHAWLALRSPDGERPVRVAETQVLDRPPDTATFVTETGEDRVTVEVRYVSGPSSRGAASPEPAVEPLTDRAGYRLASPDGPRASVGLTRLRNR